MKKGDFVIIGICVVLGLLPLLLLVPPKSDAVCAAVKVGGKTVATLPLTEDGEYVYDENDRDYEEN